MSSPPPIPDALWSRIPEEARAALAAVFAAQQERVRLLEARVAELEARLGQDSTNSSRPPSADPPTVKRPPPKPPSRRARGAQPGHPRHERPLLPPDQVQRVVDCVPGPCPCCGGRLAGSDPEPRRHQVWEIPPVRPVVTEYRLHALACAACGRATRAALPADAPAGHFGPRVHAAVALLAGAYRLGVRPTQQILADLFGLAVCGGLVAKSRAASGRLLGPVAEELHERARSLPANVDETSWREGGKRCWLWVLATADATVFRVRPTRGSAEVRELLGEDQNRVVTSDRFASYDFLGGSRRQVCWAHLRRDFQAMIDRQDAGAGIGRGLLEASDELFELWHAFREGRMPRATLARLVARVRREVGPLLARGAAGASAATAGCCRGLQRLEASLWTFASAEGVEPTNNAAERSLRHAVLWRKGSYGTDSAGGSRFVERVLSVVATCRQRGRDVWAFLTQCWDAHMTHAPTPSLLAAPTA